MASSSCPPVEMMPVTTRGALASPALNFERLAGDEARATRKVRADNGFGGDHRANHRPSTCHPGFVEATPVLKMPPPLGTATSWRYQVPISVVCSGPLAPENFRGSSA